MAIDFPNSPTNGQIFTVGSKSWIYESAYSRWTARNAPDVTVSDTAPSNPQVGSTWYNSQTGSTYIYYDSYWIEVAGESGPTGPAGTNGLDGAAADTDQVILASQIFN